ncbi:galactoside alpha-(1,2)-fucosyltransferase 2 [Patella vulgata]|uniref:galactoside alpha-(1,2)-fucosyltransferase 2 n=1 Tax=Patella vulgata TaxID=6465 RepID=UPI00218018A0|nr:galactoside alpha-(1,2)-fucosyltransferase 2 [Patella vulgata]XP_050392520.1 galactoside alpha-(1,2)-fucosyltransferase 2 [Patella vulgata]
MKTFCPRGQKSTKAILVLAAIVTCPFIFLLLFPCITDSLRDEKMRFTPIKTSDGEKFYICPILTGGIGNQMFLYASAYGIARSTNRIMLMESNTLNNLFNLDITQLSRTLCHCVPKKVSTYDCAYDEDMLNIPANINYQIGEYLQSYKYFYKYEQDIKRMFRFRQSLKDSANQFLTDVARHYTTISTTTNTQITFIGVHVRRGDMLDDYYKKYGYVLPGPDYVHKAMDFMRRKFQQTVFIFASNDVPWAKSNFYGNNIFYSSNTDPNLDLVLLASCNHSITTVGTYGWWSAFLAGGTTLYYKYPARDGSPLRKHFSSDYSDFFYPGWIGLN